MQEQCSQMANRGGPVVFVAKCFLRKGRLTSIPIYIISRDRSHVNIVTTLQVDFSLYRLLFVVLPLPWESIGGFLSKLPHI